MNRRRDRHPTNKFSEIDFGGELWSVLLKRHSDVIDCRTGSYSLKLSPYYTLVSDRYNDTYIESFLHKASTALKMLSRLEKFASSTKQPRLLVDPLPMVPLRRVALNFYNGLITKLNNVSRMQSQIDQLERNFDEIFEELPGVYSILSPLLQQNESIATSTPVRPLVDSSSTITYRKEVEKTWHQFFYHLLIQSDSAHMNLHIWGEIFEEFLGILPSYLDKVTEFTDIRMDMEKDLIVLVRNGHEEIAYFRCLWTDCLFTLVKRAFVDRQRLYSRQKNPTTVARLWSDLFVEGLEAFKMTNPEFKKTIFSTMIKSLLEKSCRSYANQFSQLIFGEFRHNQRLSMRIKELEGIYSLQAFGDQINRMALEDHAISDRNALLQAYRRALTSATLPETTSKYWNITLSDQNPQNPYGFNLHYKGSWPVNLIITPQFLANMSHSLHMMLRLLHYYTFYRAFTISCMFHTVDGISVPFTLKIQNFVCSIRQVLYRLYNCLTKKIASEIRSLRQIADEATNFNDMEADINRWKEQIRLFATDSQFSRAVSDLFECAELFVDLYNLTSQRKCTDQHAVSFGHQMESLTLNIRQNFVLACESLAPPIQEETNFTEQEAFEREISQIVGHITNDKFWKTK